MKKPLFLSMAMVLCLGFAAVSRVSTAEDPKPKDVAPKSGAPKSSTKASKTDKTDKTEKVEKVEKPGSSKPTQGSDCYHFVTKVENVMEVVEETFNAMLAKAKAKKFKELKREASFLAEMANLFTQMGEFKGKKEYYDLCEQMKTESLALSAAAEKKDEEAFKKAHAKLDDTCTACHDKFRDT